MNKPYMYKVYKKLNYFRKKAMFGALYGNYSARHEAWLFDLEMENTPFKPIGETMKLMHRDPTESMIRAACLAQSYEKFESYEEWAESHSRAISDQIRKCLIDDYQAMYDASPDIDAVQAWDIYFASMIEGKLLQIKGIL